MGKDSKSKDSKSKDSGSKGKGKQAAGGADENSSKGKGKGGKSADGLGTCTYVKGFLINFPLCYILLHSNFNLYLS